MFKKLNKPPRLKEGDTIGLISPSAPLAGLVPHRTDRAVAMLGGLGFNVLVAKNSKKITDYTAASPEERAEDIHEMFSNDDVKAVICFIGGDHSNQILPHIDFDLIRKNPKIFIGYSDPTVLHFAFLTAGKMVSFYGPSALVQFAENPKVLPYTLEYFKKAVMSTDPVGPVMPSEQWTDEVLDWFEKKDLERPRKMNSNPGWKWIQSGKAEGPIIGGCLSSAMHLKGTKYWPELQGSVFFFETSERSSDFTKGQEMADIDADLADLKNMGVFEKISGLIVGRPFGLGNEECEKFMELITSYTKPYSFPVLTGVDVGHTDPMITVPLGTNVSLDSEKNEFSFNESGVR